MMRFVDIIYSIPYMFILILLLIIFGRSFIMLFVGIGLISWLGMARVVRGQTLIAEATASSSRRRWPSGTKPMAIDLPAHRAEPARHRGGLCDAVDPRDDPARDRFISFLGLGVQEPNTSLGALISEGAQTMQYGRLWQLGFPLAFFVVDPVHLLFRRRRPSRRARPQGPLR